MLDRDAILTKLRENEREIRERFTANKLGLFGSYALGTAGSQSDVDILAELDEPTFDNYMHSS